MDKQLRQTKQSWSDMKQRCNNPNSKQFKNYGARGIAVCDSWMKSFATFLGDMGLKPEGLTLERIDNDGMYCPSNCKWASRFEQRQNQRGNRLLTFSGKTQNCYAWARELGKNPKTISGRLLRGLPIHVVLSASTLPPGWHNRAALAETAPAR